jgi:oligopeptide/dipeptide ABC transporter ATP-binding protein
MSDMIENQTRPSPVTEKRTIPLLEVRDLQTYFRTEAGISKAVDGVSFDILPGEILGLVGESGSGKSVACLSVLRLVPDPPGYIAGGSIRYRGEMLLEKSYAEMRKIRGNEIAMIFQEPMTALNPVFTIGLQVIETLRQHQRLSRRQAFERAVEMLDAVKIPDARKRMKDYPHQFSGGMRQRVMIAIALCCNPRLLIADEPTTALDVTTQAQILDLMLELKERREEASILLVTHDLGVVAETCDRVVVMYGGKVQEVGDAVRIFDNPRHPYTKGLLASLPSRHLKKEGKLYTIPGNVPSSLDMPAGCRFCTRCDHVFDRCRLEEPPLHRLADGSLVRCHLLEEEAQ